jgi:hypothetical protein
MEDRKTVATFQLVGNAKANITMTDIIIHPIINEVDTDDVVIVRSAFPLGAGKDLEKIFDDYFSGKALAFNDKYKSGVSLAELIDPRLAMIGGLIKNITVTPYVSDGWLYAGFSMYADNPISEPALSADLAQSQFVRDIVSSLIDRFGVREWLHSYEANLERTELILEPEPWMLEQLPYEPRDARMLE